MAALSVRVYMLCLHVVFQGFLQRKASLEDVKADSLIMDADALRVILQQVSNAVVSDMPDSLMCPLSLQLLKKPVLAPSGITYEHSFIRKHLKQQLTDPSTRQALKSSQLVPNRAVSNTVESLIKTSWKQSVWRALTQLAAGNVSWHAWQGSMQYFVDLMKELMDLPSSDQPLKHLPAEVGRKLLELASQSLPSIVTKQARDSTEDSLDATGDQDCEDRDVRAMFDLVACCTDDALLSSAVAGLKTMLDQMSGNTESLLVALLAINDVRIKCSKALVLLEESITMLCVRVFKHHAQNSALFAAACDVAWETTAEGNAVARTLVTNNCVAVLFDALKHTMVSNDLSSMEAVCGILSDLSQEAEYNANYDANHKVVVMDAIMHSEKSRRTLGEGAADDLLCGLLSLAQTKADPTLVGFFVASAKKLTKKGSNLDHVASTVAHSMLTFAKRSDTNMKLLLQADGYPIVVDFLDVYAGCSFVKSHLVALLKLIGRFHAAAFPAKRGVTCISNASSDAAGGDAAGGAAGGDAVGGDAAGDAASCRQHNGRAKKSRREVE